MSGMERVTISVALIFCAGAFVAAAGPPRHLDVCQAVEQVQRLNGQYISVHGYVGSDGIEHTDLLSDDCPGVSIALRMTAAATRDDPGTKLVEAALYCPPFGTRGEKVISGDFEGRLARKASPTPALQLRLVKVRNLRVYVRECAR
jgi:hypothetical protein